MRNALTRMASNTGFRSPRDALMIFRTAALAACNSRASSRSSLRRSIISCILRALPADALRFAPDPFAFFAAVTALAINPLFDEVHLHPDTRLLDVASGPGALTAEAANRGARSVGVDLSPRMIELARRLYPTIEYREADVEHLPFTDHTFDAVVCAFGLGHFPRPELAVAECVRTLSPGGRIAFAWWDDPSRQRIQGIFRDAIAEIGVSAPPAVPQGHNVFRYSNSGEFLRLLDGAGLTDTKVTDHTAT